MSSWRFSGTTDFLVPQVVFNDIVAAVQAIFNIESDFFQGQSCANFTDSDLELLAVITVRFDWTADHDLFLNVSCFFTRSLQGVVANTEFDLLVYPWQYMRNGGVCCCHCEHLCNPHHPNTF